MITTMGPNNGLGNLPVSTFICIDELYSRIFESYGAWKILNQPRDIIIYGSIHDNIKILHWLTARLLYDMYYVSVVFDKTNGSFFGDLAGVKAQRMIVKTTPRNFIRDNTHLRTLSHNDVIIITQVNELSELQRLHKLLPTLECSKIFVEQSEILNYGDLIKSGLYEFTILNKIEVVGW